jgi:hypothetical protein
LTLHHALCEVLCEALCEVLCEALCERFGFDLHGGSLKQIMLYICLFFAMDREALIRVKITREAHERSSEHIIYFDARHHHNERYLSI